MRQPSGRLIPRIALRVALIVCGLLVGLAFPAVASAAVSFATPELVAGTDVPGGPDEAATADFDRDGTLDIAAGVSDGVTLAYGDGAGAFPSGQTVHAGGNGTSRIAVGDFDGQNGPDLAVMSGRLDIVLNDGSGGFESPVSLGGAGEDVESGDFDGDGHLDLAISVAAGVELRKGDGTGEFGAPVFYLAGAVPGSLALPRSLVAGDLDGDGRDDLAVADESNDAVVLLFGLADGGFAHGGARYVGSSPRGIALLDVNGDRRLDLAVGGLGEAAVTLFTGDGAGLFVERETEPTAGYVYSLHAADFDADGNDDLVAGSFEGLDLLLADGLGGVDSTATFELDRQPPGAYALTGGDFNNDGEEDLAAGWREINVLLGEWLEADNWAVGFDARLTGTGSPSEAVTIANTATNDVSITLASIEGDDAQQFELTEDRCSARMLSPGETCEVRVRYVPTVEGEALAHLILDSDAPTGPHSVVLGGAAADGPELELLHEEPLDFGQLPAGDRSAPQTVVLTNPGILPAHVGPVSLGGSQAFSISEDSCAGATLEPGGWCAVSITFTQREAGAFEATLTIHSDAEAAPHVVALRGGGASSGPPTVMRMPLQVVPYRVSFGRVPEGTSQVREVVVRNISDAKSDPLNSRIEGTPGAPSDQFQVSADTCGHVALSPGSACRIAVRYTAPAAGRQTAFLRISWGTWRVGVSLTGESVRATRPPAPSPPTIAGALLARPLRAATARWARARRQTLRRRGFVVTGIEIPSAGTAHLTLRQVRPGRAVVIARGQVEVSPGTRTTLRARITAAGRKLLRRRRPLNAHAAVSFAALDGRRATATRAVRLRRG